MYGVDAGVNGYPETWGELVGYRLVCVSSLSIMNSSQVETWFLYRARISKMRVGELVRGIGVVVT